MERRTFIKLSSSLCATGMLGLSQFIYAEEKPSLISEPATRLQASAIKELGIVFPTETMSAPSVGDVQVTMRPDAIRRYSENTYVHFELQQSIQVFDTRGEKTDKIVYSEFVHGVKDFAVDEELQLIYFLGRGQNHVDIINFQGELLGSIGEFGIELPEQLNAPRSITLDANKRLHILCGGSNLVKVFEDNGAYAFSYSASLARRPQMMRQLDGTKVINISGGRRQDRHWKFDLKGKALN